MSYNAIRHSRDWTTYARSMDEYKDDDPSYHYPDAGRYWWVPWVLLALTVSIGRGLLG